jgi:cell division protein ZapA
MDEQSIKVVIADRTYPLKVKRNDEEIFREATKYINDRLKDYAANYSIKDKQDAIAMVALQYTTSALKNERVLAFRDKELVEKLTSLNAMLDANV